MTLFLQVLLFVKANLIMLMAGFLLTALAFRYIAYKAGRRDEMYFKTFARGIEKQLDIEGKGSQIKEIEAWLTELLTKVTDQLPHRSMRQANMQGKSAGFRAGRESFTEFAEGRKSILFAIRQQLDAFKGAYPPNFDDLTTRVLEQDRQWKTVLGVVPVEMVSRMLDILPSLFVVGGIFGTFVGVMAGLPQIAQIDLNHIDQAGPILGSFVKDIAFSMNASIVGIACNIVMTVLNAMFPVAEVRSNIKQTVERSLELIWYRIHGTDESKSEAQVIELLTEIVEELRGAKRQRPGGRGAA